MTIINFDSDKISTHIKLTRYKLYTRCKNENEKRIKYLKESKKKINREN